MPKYIISLKHTHKEDAFIVLWCPNLSGYTYFKEAAGTYDRRTIKANDLNNFNSTIAINEKKLADLWFKTEDSYGYEVHVLPNLPKTRKALGILKAKFIKQYPGTCPSISQFKRENL